MEQLKIGSVKGKGNVIGNHNSVVNHFVHEGANEDSLSMKEAERMDLMLSHCLNLNREPISPMEIKKDVLPDLSLSQIRLLVQGIGDHSPQPAYVGLKTDGEYIMANGSTEGFLNNGGFKRLSIAGKLPGIRWYRKAWAVISGTVVFLSCVATILAFIFDWL